MSKPAGKSRSGGPDLAPGETTGDMGAQTSALRLKFRDPGLEQEFWNQFQLRHRVQNRIAVLLGLLVFVLFALVDNEVGGSHRNAIWMIRLGIALPVLCGGMIGFFVDRIAHRFTGPLVFLVLFVSGISIVIMNILLPPEYENLYFTGLLIVLVFGHGFFRTDFRWPSAAILLVFGVYLATAHWIDPIPGPVLVTSFFYYVSAAVIMIYTGWLLEQQERSNFLMEHQLWRLAHIDDLTGLANRRAFIDHFAAEWRRALRDKRPISLLLVDLDHLKQINDTGGHEAGDAALKRLAQVLRSAARRPGDLAARLGGDEFILLLSGCDHGQAIKIARRLAAGGDLAANSQQSVTASIGLVSTIPSPNLTLELLLQQADQALYQAKRNGRAQAVGMHVT